MPAISVLLPCYNAATTLDEALDSLARQTLADFEVITVDDGSTDATGALLAAWAAADSRFRVLSCPHRGIIPALNAGLTACHAPYVARLDADDRTLPTRLEKQAAYLDAHPEIALVSCQVRGFPTSDMRRGFQIYLDWLNNLIADADIRREIFVESPLPHPSVAFRKAWVERLGGYQEHGWPEDYDLWLRMYLTGAQFAKIPEVLVEWREHPDRLTRTDRRYSVENFLRAKAHYLARGPLQNRDGVILWGAGMIGRRLGKQLQRQNLPLKAYIEINPHKIGGLCRSQPIIAPEELLDWWGRYQNPALLAAVSARGAREIIRQRLAEMGLVEGRDWWGAA
ncbi:MAG TPA: glycosyl transferase [Chloroflexi bacterium]|nr:glycosyl transferase [Chloroflexota bacterium]